mmetsp:Transcript_18965/g.52911  ORF Transcript_18965/g.52911 Transcript_18965/m.52911 type:complete len:241 (+) Transcript_18965:237-959(+)|eukprot:CAMPEP_0172362704 /NCGR_PEP_ID=MMETSP1060-20121228/6248_1 /TAXON_ID=37318 /ORGANISM="Pseudo-nitzschia pungens, Strain cf. cingulata" /LENGTH=240 /DNA_ID=CAMNT_0013085263 /DNA_START=220 /DNA_END=942 /DNA_ORIENTATION=+
MSGPGHHRKASSGQFYFVSKHPGLSESVRDARDNVAVIEPKRSGAGDEEYEPKPVNRNLSIFESDRSIPAASQTPRMNPLSRTLFALFGRNQKVRKTSLNDSSNEGAKKVDPKVFFANERNFLKWMNVSVWVAGLSIGLSSIVGSSGEYRSWESYSSLLFLAIAIVISCYCMIQFARRSLMIVKRSPGPWEDRSGPIVIGTLFVITFAAQYCMYIASWSITILEGPEGGDTVHRFNGTEA